MLPVRGLKTGPNFGPVVEGEVVCGPGLLGTEVPASELSGRRCPSRKFSWQGGESRSEPAGDVSAPVTKPCGWEMCQWAPGLAVP